MSLKNFQTYARHFSEYLQDFSANLHNGWTTSAAISLLPLITYHRYSEGNASQRMVKEASGRLLNVDFVHSVFPEKFVDLRRGGIVMLRMLRNIEPVGKLFATYGFCSIFSAPNHSS